jgi:heme exporter protein A
MAAGSESPELRRVVARKLVKSFGPIAALRGVDLELLTGLTVIAGPNGSGKTTLLRILGCALRPTSGSVRYEPLGDDLARVRAAIGWLSHEPAAYPDLTGRANIELAAELLGLEPDRAWQRCVERFDLGRFAERPLRTNSRGQRQRIALARALVHDPSLVLLDEPTAGLDRSSVGHLKSAISELIERRAIVVVVSHDDELFSSFSSTYVNMERGRVRAVRAQAPSEG